MYSCIDIINVKGNICDSIKREKTLLTPQITHNRYKKNSYI